VDGVATAYILLIDVNALLHSCLLVVHPPLRMQLVTRVPSGLPASDGADPKVFGGPTQKCLWNPGAATRALRCGSFSCSSDGGCSLDRCAPQFRNARWTECGGGKPAESLQFCCGTPPHTRKRGSARVSECVRTHTLGDAWHASPTLFPPAGTFGRKTASSYPDKWTMRTATIAVALMSTTPCVPAMPLGNDGGGPHASADLNS
jgi:hypothetical protein